MASTTLKFATILYFALSLTLAWQSQSLSFEGIDDEEDQEYILDTPLVQGGLSMRRSLATIFIVKKGAYCDATKKKKKNICDGVSANNGQILLNCCNKHCRNILGDRNNCGACGVKCKNYWSMCCNRKCTDVLFDSNNCGKCGKKCAKGVACQLGVCGYA